jgi:RNA polymerase sigma-70 factor (ECF subfamily)
VSTAATSPGALPRAWTPADGLRLLRLALATAMTTATTATTATATGDEHADGRRSSTERVTEPVVRPSRPARVVVPVPTSAGDDAPDAPDPSSAPEPPEGEAAQSLALVRRAQAGDAEAFGELYDRYVDLVYRYVSYRVGSAALAEDLTSETFLRALRRITSFTWQGRDVGAWFITIARNLIADHYKSGRYRLELTTDDVGDSGAPLVAEGPEGEVLASMQNAVLLAAVRQLNPEQQECISLRFLQGLSVAETALAMGKNDGAVKALQYRAIRSLGRLLPDGLEL